MPYASVETLASSWPPTPESLVKRPVHTGALAIDPEAPLEIDDAISVKRLSRRRGEYAVRIHVANAGLLYGTPYVDAAREEGWTRYTEQEGEITQPMLPIEISRDYLDLSRSSSVGTPAITIAFEFNDERKNIGAVSVKETRVYAEGISYGGFRQQLREKRPAAKEIEKGARKLAAKLGIRNISSSYNVPEEIVATFMIAGNHVVTQQAATMAKGGLPWLFRNNTGDAYMTWDDERQRKIMESLRIALYDSVAMKHEGLGIDPYCHFTSPLRRFADFANHLTLHAHLNGLPLPYDEKEIREIARELTAKYVLRSGHFRELHSAESMRGAA